MLQKLLIFLFLAAGTLIYINFLIFLKASIQRVTRNNIYQNIYKAASNEGSLFITVIPSLILSHFLNPQIDQHQIISDEHPSALPKLPVYFNQLPIFYAIFAMF